MVWVWWTSTSFLPSSFPLTEPRHAPTPTPTQTRKSNNPHNLTRLDIEPGNAGHYALALSQYEKAHDLAFTLSVFATRPFTLRPAPSLPPVAAALEGVWTHLSAGGRLGQRGFMHNPQFSLVINRPSRLFIELLAPKDFFVSFSLLGGHRGGRRVDSILQGEELITSGAYRQGFCYAESHQADVPPGLYTAVVSTYEAGLTGAFVLNVRSETPLQQAKSLLPEGDGMVKQVVRGSWSAVEGTAGGSRPPMYINNPTFSIACTERARVLLRLVCDGANEPVNVTLFQGSPSPPSFLKNLASSILNPSPLCIHPRPPSPRIVAAPVDLRHGGGEGSFGRRGHVTHGHLHGLRLGRRHAGHGAGRGHAVPCRACHLRRGRGLGL